jgi:hypothetical protein
MLAVPTDRLPEALGDLDPGNRALLDLSLRRGVSDAEIGELLRKEPADVARGRDAVLELLADALDVPGPDRRERVRQAVAELPDDAWRPARAPSPPPPPPVESKLPPVPPPPSPPRPSGDDDLDAPSVERHRGDDELYFEPEPRRSRRGGLLLILALLAVLGAILALILGGGDDDGSNESGSQPAPQRNDDGGKPAPTPNGRTAQLEPLPGGRGEGRLVVTDEGATITLRGLPNPGGGVYQAWLYDSVVNAKSLGTVGDGEDLEVQLPADARRFQFLDVSLEPADGNPNHSGDSVLRARLRDVLRD